MTCCDGSGKSGVARDSYSRLVERYRSSAKRGGSEELCGDSFPPPPEYGEACCSEWCMAYTCYLQAEYLSEQFAWAQQQATITRNELDQCLAAHVYPV